LAPDAAPDTVLLIDAAKAGGEIALKHFKTDVKTFQKDDDSPVTVADLEINEMLGSHLGQARPDYGWLSEEDEDNNARLGAEHVFIIDPIDGTRAFINGEAGFAIALAVARHGRVTSAVVHLPARNETYSATAGEGAVKNGNTLAVSAVEKLEHATVLTARKQMAPEHWPGGVPVLKRSFRPSLAWRMCLVAEGVFDSMLTFRAAYEWDIAAGALIAEEAGAHVTDADGEGMHFNSAPGRQSGVIVASPVLHRHIMAHRSPGN
jgi:myo-inositol-1(or 4)-monophosphatase